MLLLRSRRLAGTRVCLNYGWDVIVVPVQRAWLFEKFAITVEVIDFLDPHSLIRPMLGNAGYGSRSGPRNRHHGDLCTRRWQSS